MNSSTLVPCVICGLLQPRVMQDTEAQPDHGLMFTTTGNYGSTVFDPDDGTALLVIICDGCIVRASEQQRVLTYKKYRHVLCDGIIVGREWLGRPYTMWTRDDPGYGESDVLNIEAEEVGRDLGPRVEWTHSALRGKDLLEER